MDRKHLIYIIPLCIAIGLIIGAFGVAMPMARTIVEYPVINCIMGMEDYLNVPDIKQNELIQQAIQKRCAEETIDFNVNLSEAYKQLGEYIWLKIDN